MSSSHLVELARTLLAGTKIHITISLEQQPQVRAGDASQASGSPEAAREIEMMPKEKRLKIADASRLSGISERELRRAKETPYLAYHVKEHGRDAGAHMITAGELCRYQERREAILELREDPPEDWPGPGGLR